MAGKTTLQKNEKKKQKREAPRERGELFGTRSGKKEGGEKVQGQDVRNTKQIKHKS